MKRFAQAALMMIAVSGFANARMLVDSTKPRAQGTRAQGGLEARMDRFLKKLASDSGFSGAVFVARQETIMFHKGYGWESQRKDSSIRTDTRFYIASISKQFTAAAILKLEEQRTLSVSDRIASFFKDIPEDKRAITIHHLLTHTSGLAQNYAADGIVDRDEAVRAVLKSPLKSPPGERFGYSNDGYTLLAAIVEIASGQRYEAYLRRHLLEPAGMERTGFWGDPPGKGERPIAQTLRAINEEVKMPNWGFRGATGMSSTVIDLYKWHRALVRNTALRKTSREKLMTPYVTTSRGGYGYGWFVSKTKRGDEVIWTAGAEDFGHNAIIKSYKDGTVIIVASNAGNISGVPARDVVSAELERILFETDTGGEKNPSGRE
jgi:CubicO group peptidase (beta-lactamase class C family)